MLAVSWDTVRLFLHVLADPMSASYRTTLIVKLIVVAASGISAVAHSRSRSTVGLAVWGALTGLTALSALFLGVLLAG